MMNEHDQLFDSASKLIWDDIQLHGRPNSGLGYFTKRRLNSAIKQLERVVQLNPSNWSAMWLLGKGYQRLADHTRALHWFDRAFRINDSNADVAREAASCALELGQGPDAVEYSQAALKADPSDAGLIANLALAHLIAGATELAVATAAEAVAIDPSDGISRNVLRVASEVSSGSRQQPRRLGDLQ